MAIYRYKARDQQSKPVEGMMSGDSQDAVANKLKDMGYLPISIEESSKNPSARSSFNLFNRIRFSEVNLFTRQLFALQKAGLPILSSLAAITEQAENPRFKNILGQMQREIEAGSDLSSAMEKHAKVFNPIYTNMIRSGEVSGRLTEILERLATLGEHEERIRLQVKSALRYPLIVVSTLVLGFFVLVTFVMPRYIKIYGQFQVELPIPTKILIGIHYAITHYWWLLIVAAGILVFVFVRFAATREGGLLIDRLKLKIPVFGPLLLKVTMSQFCRVTGMLMRSGLPILQILDLLSESIGNVVIAGTLEDIQASVNEGQGMLAPMKNSGWFPPVVTQMVSVGEETGKLDELLLHVSEYYDSQIDYTISNLISLIEPILIFFLGLAVTFMALGVFLPMWNIMNLFRR